MERMPNFLLRPLPAALEPLAMLALAAEIRTHDGGLSLAAVTVDHGLRPEAAAEADPQAAGDEPAAEADEGKPAEG